MPFVTRPMIQERRGFAWQVVYLKQRKVNEINTRQGTKQIYRARYVVVYIYIYIYI